MTFPTLRLALLALLAAFALVACSTKNDTIGGNCGFPKTPTITTAQQAAQPTTCPATVPPEVLTACPGEATDVSCSYSVNCANVLDAAGNSYTLTADIGQGTNATFAGKLSVFYTPTAGDDVNCAYDETIR